MGGAEADAGVEERGVVVGGGRAAGLCRLFWEVVRGVSGWRMFLRKDETRGVLSLDIFMINIFLLTWLVEELVLESLLFRRM